MFQYKTLCFNKKTAYLKKKQHTPTKKNPYFPKGSSKGVPRTFGAKKKQRTSVEKMLTLAEKMRT